MASIKGLKKNVTTTLADLIDAVSIFEITSGKGQTEDTKKIINEILNSYDNFVENINNKKVENRKSHIEGVRKNFYTFVENTVEKINALR